MKKPTLVKWEHVNLFKTLISVSANLDLSDLLAMSRKTSVRLEATSVRMIALTTTAHTNASVQTATNSRKMKKIV